MRFIAVSTIIAIGVFFAACSNNNKKEISENERIQKGKYLVTVGGCNDCHSPKLLTANGPIPDTNKLLSGHPAAEVIPTWDTTTAKSFLLFTFTSTAAHGPWGTSFAANLTPDETGIGNWTEEQFMNAMQKGYLHGVVGARRLLPPMPWTTYAKMEVDDIKAIFHYLKSLPPVHNIVPEPLPPGKIPS